MEACLKTGAYVHLPDYGLSAPADIFQVGSNRVVRFNGDPRVAGQFHSLPQRSVTHTLYLNRQQNWWRPDLGVAVVAAADLEDIT